MTQIKILDFNVAVELDKNEKMFGATGEPKFSAPEMNDGSFYDNKVDVWSAGIVLYHLLSEGENINLGDSGE
jgi:serine/threonine protein kinase